MKTFVKIIGAIFTAMGLTAFFLGLYLWEYELLAVGLLAMILGELVDMPHRIREKFLNLKEGIKE